METTVRKISKAVLYPPGDDQFDGRPRGISGATITSWDGPPEVDLETLFSNPDNQVSVAGAGSQTVRAASPAATVPTKDEPVSFTTIERFVTVATV